MHAQALADVLEALRQAPNGLTVSGLVRCTNLSGVVVDRALQRLKEQNLVLRSTRVLWHPYGPANDLSLEDDVQ